MTSRERIARAINHREVDRLPVDFGGTVVTCIDKDAHAALCGHLGIPCGDVPVIDYTMGTVEPDERIMKLFGSDVRRISMNVEPPKIVNNRYTDGFGMELQKAGKHNYFDVIRNPLRDADAESIAGMQMPDPGNPRLYEGIEDKARTLYENTDYAIFADYGVPGFYETAQKLRGYENFACDLLSDPDLVHTLYDRLLDLQKRFFRNYLGKVGKYAQVIGYADDLGMQDRPQISPELYRTMIKPYHKEIFRFIHEQADIKIMLHCCGAVFPLIEDLIDAGVDILNPVQPNARGMDLKILKETFGKKIVFWGGIDEQQLLPAGTPEEIRAKVHEIQGIMGKEGGYVAAVSHNIQSDTPPENIAAVFRALGEQ
jgi:uroporphyrinogen decarboxylase